MAQKPRKDAVRDMIKNLVDSEIPEIQAVAKQLADRIKQLEEHSWRLQHYASEIETLAAEDAEGPIDSNIDNLTELLKDLEKTLGELRQPPKGTVTGARGKAEEKAEEIAGKVQDMRRKEEVVDKVSEVSEEPSPVADVDTYTTPEGFVVRRKR